MSEIIYTVMVYIYTLLVFIFMNNYYQDLLLKTKNDWIKLIYYLIFGGAFILLLIILGYTIPRNSISRLFLGSLWLIAIWACLIKRMMKDKNLKNWEDFKKYIKEDLKKKTYKKMF